MVTAKLCGYIRGFLEFIRRRIRLHAPGGYPVGAAWVRTDDAAGCLVGAAAPDVYGPRSVRRLRDVGGVSRASITSSDPICRRSIRRCSSVKAPHSWFGPKPGWWPAALPFSAALLILWAPGGFRFTCYYYRGAYYKAFWADPPSCAVGEPRKKYLGEQSFPLILQNIHRYFLYLAILFLFVLTYDVWKAMWFTDAAGSGDVRHRRRHDCVLAIEHGAPQLLHARLPFVPAPRRRRPRSVLEASRAAEDVRRRQLPQLPPHEVCLGQPVLASRWPTSTSGCARWASSRTGGCSELRDSRARCARYRRGRSRAPRRDRGVGGRGQSRAALQVTSRQGAHRHGRRRRRGGARQRRRPRQLEGAFRRHDARRPVRQQLADGRAPRQGSAGSRPRARGMGRALRSHGRTAASSSAISAATSIRAWLTSAIAPASR